MQDQNKKMVEINGTFNKSNMHNKEKKPNKKISGGPKQGGQLLKTTQHV